MRRTVTVRNVTFGAGVPKVCVPIVGRTEEEIVNAARMLLGSVYDLVEWRVDWYESCNDVLAVTEIAGKLRKILPCPILFTFRSQREGGERAMEFGNYADLLTTIACSELVDMIDIELFSADETKVRKLVQNVKDFGAAVVMSSHDFRETPEDDEMLRRLSLMEKLGCDIAKLAVMPTSKTDVARLLLVTAKADERLECLLITMSMSRTGVISRLTGEVFGSCLTFGAVGKASAPGQIGSAELEDILQTLHTVV